LRNLNPYFQALLRHQTAIIAYDPRTREALHTAMISSLRCDKLPARESSLSSSTSMQSSKHLGFKAQAEGKLLIVTSKAMVESWADCCRSDLKIKLLLYTSSLADRRRLGLHSIGRHDVVITTFDVSLERL
jgi:hypothetical protein